MTGRNDKCPCGSGRKYKKCCYRAASAAVQAAPPDPFLAAVAQHQAGRLEAAEAGYRALLQRQPQHADAIHYLGLIAYQRGGYAQAVGLFEQSIRLRPGVAGYQTNLGNALKKLGRSRAALAAYQQAVRCEPTLAAAQYNLGSLQLALADQAGALDGLRRAVQLDPDNPTYWLGYGRALMVAEDLDAAHRCFDRALTLAPQLHEAHAAIAEPLLRFGEVATALQHYRHAVQLQPGNLNYHSSLIFALNLLEEDPVILHREACQRMQPWEQRIAPLPPPSEGGTERRLRIGYLSHDLRQHAMRFFIEPILRHHARAEFELFCYYTHPCEDASSQHLKTLSEHWVHCAALDDQALARRIRADGIDILIDLSGHTTGHRLGTLLQKPAPVQMQMLGYLNTSGLTRIDYRIADPVTAPAGRYEALSSETLLRLPHCQWCYQPPAAAPTPSALPAALPGALVFGAPHNVAKIGPAMIAVWARILARLPASRLRLVAWGERAKRNLTRAFAAQGIALSQLEFVEPLPFEQYLGFYQQVDLVLDSYPYSGGTTACESLWMGVPYVTYAGDAPMGRGGASILSALQLEALIAHSLDQYVDIAVALAHDLPTLADWRATLRRRMQASPLLDGAAYTAALEQLYRQAWAERTAGAPAPRPRDADVQT